MFKSFIEKYEDFSGGRKAELRRFYNIALAGGVKASVATLRKRAHVARTQHNKAVRNLNREKERHPKHETAKAKLDHHRAVHSALLDRRNVPGAAMDMLDSPMQLGSLHDAEPGRAVLNNRINATFAQTEQAEARHQDTELDFAVAEADGDVVDLDLSDDSDETV